MFNKPSLSMIFFQHGSQRWHHQHPLQHGGVSVHLYDLTKQQFYFDPLWSRVKQISIILKMHTHNQAFLTFVLPRYDEGTICTVSGWGTTTEGGSLARVLQKVNMIIIHHGVRVDHVCDCDADALMLRWPWSKWSWFSGRRPCCVWRALPWLLRTERHHRLHDLCW